MAMARKSLPLLNSETVSNDLIENTIQVVGEEDGVFNDSDYILMYAIGPKKLQLRQQFTHQSL